LAEHTAREFETKTYTQNPTRLLLYVRIVYFVKTSNDFASLRFVAPDPVAIECGGLVYNVFISNSLGYVSAKNWQIWMASD